MFAEFDWMQALFAAGLGATIGLIVYLVKRAWEAGIKGHGDSPP